ncbi:UDP-N-acetylmuramyl-tripeptide synthetase [Candidatus Wolfebacteria bacterium]|nr:UDP-N-acetylmuramyl-tripeptide synthetase [Candidatus Wolfebacteria bacterium]
MNINNILFFLKKLIPKQIFVFFQPGYHFMLSFLAAFFYGFPSRKMIVIGVTGTKGKTTTCNLITQILNFSGRKTGMATTVNFRIGDKEWKNETKQTMLGRFQLQKLLKQMAGEKCEYAVIETSSEGILQYRHCFIDYNIVVFTNLSPEHIERHNGFENYRDAKVKLFEKAVRKKDGIGVYNLDDENVEYFLKPDVKNKYGYGIKFSIFNFQFLNNFQISNIKLLQDKTKFEINNENFEMPLIGEFNVYNATAAICVALSQNIPIEKIKEALKLAKSPIGRMEIIKTKDFSIIIDYAHEPASLEAVYKAVIDSKLKVNSPAGGSKLICLLGAQGGGRDKWKRLAMGKIAAQYCDEIILTNEDPYDENPSQILSDIKSGISNFQFSISKIYEIIDRKEAIKKAISLAKKGDVVILTGKGGESWMCVENNKKIPWDEKEIVGHILKIDI